MCRTYWKLCHCREKDFIFSSQDILSHLSSLQFCFCERDIFPRRVEAKLYKHCPQTPPSLTSQGWESSWARYTKVFKLWDVGWLRVGAGDGNCGAATVYHLGRASRGWRGGIRGSRGDTLIRHAGNCSVWMIPRRTGGGEKTENSVFIYFAQSKLTNLVHLMWCLKYAYTLVSVFAVCLCSFYSLNSHHAPFITVWWVSCFHTHLLYICGKSENVPECVSLSEWLLIPSIQEGRIFKIKLKYEYDECALINNCSFTVLYDKWFPCVFVGWGRGEFTVTPPPGKEHQQCLVIYFHLTNIVLCFCGHRKRNISLNPEH